MDVLPKRFLLLPLCLGLWARHASSLGGEFPFFEPVQPPRPARVMVHRGEAGQAPESTRPALARCIEDNLD